MIKQVRLERILEALDERYGKEHVCYLSYKNDWQLLIATQLSAQCTDERVNKVTPELFRQFPSCQAFAQADVRDIEVAVHSTGFYRNKAKNIKACCKKILEEHHGQVPKTMAQLIQLPGVGRKTANVVLGHVHQQSGVVVDTHVKRISNLLGITHLKDPVKIEYDLMDKLPEEHWLRFNTQIIAHGRSICVARRPKCDQCFLLKDCPSGLSIQLDRLIDDEK